MKKEKKRPTGFIITAVIFGLLDVAALALLICVIFISPAKKKAVEVSLPADFQENAQGYDSLDMTADYPSSATVSYAAPVLSLKSNRFRMTDWGILTLTIQTT